MTADAPFETVDTHTGGEPTRLVTGGLDRSAFEGGSVAEQRDAFAETHDRVRELAAELDISKTTLLEHLRKAEAKLLNPDPETLS